MAPPRSMTGAGRRPLRAFPEARRVSGDGVFWTKTAYILRICPENTQNGTNFARRVEKRALRED